MKRKIVFVRKYENFETHNSQNRVTLFFHVTLILTKETRIVKQIRYKFVEYTGKKKNYTFIFITKQFTAKR